jgi:cytoskeletal protein CcmA (bactofilin family)
MIFSRVKKYFKSNVAEGTHIEFYDGSQANHYFESLYPIVIENHYKGTIVCLEDVFVKRNASFSGDLICKRCLIAGSLSGNILATEYTEISKSAFLDAGILTGSIFIENKAAAMGELRITKEIDIPESLIKLQDQMKSAPTQNEDNNIGTKKIKRIILRQGSPTTLLKLPAPISPAELKENELTTSVPQIPLEQRQVPAVEKNIPENTVSGWW